MNAGSVDGLGAQGDPYVLVKVETAAGQLRRGGPLEGYPSARERRDFWPGTGEDVSSLVSQALASFQSRMTL